MPRKRMYEPDRYNRPFPSRLREIMEETGTTQQALADYLGMKNRQSIGFYCEGRSYPDLDAVAKIAGYFHVSADWLLGLSDVRKPDTTMQAVCDYTGLSEGAVQWLRNSSWIGAYNKIISNIIENDGHTFLFAECEKYISLKKMYHQTGDSNFTIGAITISLGDMVNGRLGSITNLLRNTLDKIALEEHHAKEI